MKSDKKPKATHPPLNAPIGWRKGSDVSTAEAASFIRRVEFWNPRIDCLSRGVEVAVVDDRARTAEGAKSLEAIPALNSFVKLKMRFVERRMEENEASCNSCTYTNR